MTDYARGDVRERDLHGRKNSVVVRPQVSPQPVPLSTPAGIAPGDIVDVLLERGGYIGATFIGTRKSDLFVFSLPDGRVKGAFPEEIVVIRRAVTP